MNAIVFFILVTLASLWYLIRWVARAVLALIAAVRRRVGVRNG